MTTREDLDRLLHFIQTYFVIRDNLHHSINSIITSSCHGAMTPDTVATNEHNLNAATIRLCKITLFPIKSCGGMVVSSWPLGPCG
jgi:hypothetical protein